MVNWPQHILPRHNASCHQASAHAMGACPHHHHSHDMPCHVYPESLYTQFQSFSKEKKRRGKNIKKEKKKKKKKINLYFMFTSLSLRELKGKLYILLTSLKILPNWKENHIFISLPFPYFNQTHQHQFFLLSSHLHLFFFFSYLSCTREQESREFSFGE